MKNTATQWVVPIVVGAMVSAGMALSGFFIGHSIAQFKRSDRAVVVKGLSEREVKSDLGELMLIFKNPGNDLALMQKKNEQDAKNVMDFLHGKGLAKDEMALDGTELFDRQAREYGDQEKSENRYIMTTRVKVTTKKVDLIRAIYNQTTDLIRLNINLSTNIRYFFTQFNNLRAEMIAEATQSARQAANQFAKDSDSHVGEIRNAVQGAFSITSPNEEYNEAGSLQKKIRVVTTVTFNLAE